MLFQFVDSIMIQIIIKSTHIHIIVCEMISLPWTSAIIAMSHRKTRGERAALQRTPCRAKQERPPLAFLLEAQPRERERGNAQDEEKNQSRYY